MTAAATARQAVKIAGTLPLAEREIVLNANTDGWVSDYTPTLRQMERVGVIDQVEAWGAPNSMGRGRLTLLGLAVHNVLSEGGAR